MDKNQKFIEEIYSLCDAVEIEKATDRIYLYIDDLLLQGKFKQCDDLLPFIDVTKIPSTLMRSFLVATYAAKNKLNNRKNLYDRSHNQMIKIRGEEVAAELLNKLI